MEIIRKTIGYYHRQPVEEITLINRFGGYFTVWNYGATVHAIGVPDKNGVISNVVLSAPSLEETIAFRPLYGAIVGPIAGRMSGKIHEKNSIVNHLEKNEKAINHLHGGSHGLDTKLWKIIAIESEEEVAYITLETVNYPGEGGYPGELIVQVIYSWSDDFSWTIHYHAKTSQKTLFKPTNHVYFNLTGHQEEKVLGHHLTVQSSQYALLTEENIPDQHLSDVTGTAFDLRAGKYLKEIVHSSEKQIKKFNGLDHLFYLDHQTPSPDAEIYDPHSGRVVQMKTDEDTVVIYMHNNSFPYFSQYEDQFGAYSGITLETQRINQKESEKELSNIFLNPGCTYNSRTTYHFLVKN